MKKRSWIAAVTVGVTGLGTSWAGTASANPYQGPDELAPIPKPVISIADASTSEGNAGIKLMHFSVTLNKSWNQTVKANVQTVAAVSNPATANTDYSSKFAVLEFQPGVTARTFSVSIKGDTTVEANEKFGAALGAVSNATKGKATGMGTIVNDDYLIVNPPKPEPQPQPDDNDDEPTNGGGSSTNGAGGGATSTTVPPSDGNEQALGLEGANGVARPEDSDDLTAWLVILTALLAGTAVIILLLPPRRRRQEA